MTTTPAMPERFTKKPVTVEAVQFTEALRDAIVLDGAPCPDGVTRGATTWHQKDRKIWRADFFIDTLEGRMNVEIGDWIIKRVKGEFYPCKPDIFEMTYDRATLQAQPAAEVSDDADAHFDKIMEQAQVFASAWSLVGGRFDMGNGLEEAEAAKSELRSLVARAILALRPQPSPQFSPDSPHSAPVSGPQAESKWEGAEEWMPLAWELCAEEHGEEACNELIWTGGPIPEPWGDRWLQYEDEAKRLITLVRKHVPSPRPQAVPMTCAWEQEDECGSAYSTTCGNTFMFEDGGPSDNGAKFCCYCGGRLSEQKWVEPADDGGITAPAGGKG